MRPQCTQSFITPILSALQLQLSHTMPSISGELTHLRIGPLVVALRVCLSCRRVANIMPMIGTFDMLLTLVSSAFLYRKMKEINDLFNTSKELLAVGCFAILSLGELAMPVCIVYTVR